MILEQWRQGELALTASLPTANPFLDLDLFCEFHGPAGETITRLGFWDGELDYKVRFLLPKVGRWTYRTWATNGDPALVSTGELDCVPYAGDKDIYRHGFLRLGPQNRYFIYDDGTPFFWLGDTHWTFVTEERWDESNCPKYESQFRACVDKRVAQRFTVYESNFRDGDPEFRMFGRYDQYLLETENGYLPNIPFLKANPDPKMQYIADAGLVNAVGFSWNAAITRPNGEDRLIRLAKYLVARYGAYPVLWTIGGELPGYGGGDKTALIEGWRRVALETEKWDCYDHLTTFHQATGRPFLDLYAGEKWYDFALTQGAHGDAPFYPEMYSEFREKYPKLPIVEGECLYEGATSNEMFTRVITPQMMRTIAWMNFQTGGCGYTYGCNGVWELQWEAGKGGIGWGDMAWWDGLELPGADQLTLMRDFYEQVGWQKLRPIQGLLEHRGFGDGKGVLAAADENTDTVVVYFLPAAGKVCTLHGLAHKSYTARWFNPETGEYTLLNEDANPVNGVWSVPMSEGLFTRDRHDRVLLLEANK